MNRGKFGSLWFIPVAAALLQSGHATECSNSSGMLSLVGDTMSSKNNVPFDWSSDYEIAVVYITSMWSELESGDPILLGIIAKNGYLSYCVSFHTELASWTQSLEDNPDVNETVKSAASSWYLAIDRLARDNWQMPETLTLESFRKQFMTSYKHLVINGAEVYEEALGERTRRNVDDFTRKVADVLLKKLREVTVFCRSAPERQYNGSGNLQTPVSAR